jgi:TP901 family phage tail tape measure protein
MDKAFVIGMVIGATAQVGSAIAGIGKVGSALESLKQKKVNLGEKLIGLEKASLMAEQKVTRIGSAIEKLNQRKILLEQNLVKFPHQADVITQKINQIGSTVERLNQRKLVLGAELEKSKSSAGALNKELIKVGGSIEKIEGSLAGAKSRSDMRKEIQGNVIGLVAMGATLASPIKKAIEFESVMADVAKVVDFTGEAEKKLFAGRILEKSRITPVSATGLGEIAAAGGQLGIAKDQLLDFTDVVARMSTAFDMSAGDAGESMAKIMNIYELNVERAEKLGDAINQLGNTSAARERDIVNVLARVGGTARVFGLAGKSAAALGSAMLSLGRSPEVAATGINAMLMKLKTADRQGKEFQAALNAIGYSAEQLKADIEKDAEGALIKFLERLKGVKKEELAGILSDLVGMQYSDDLALLVSGLDQYKRALKETQDETRFAGAMQKEFENRAKTTANQLQLLKNNLTASAISIGNVFLPAVNSVVGAVTPVLGAMGKVAEKFPTITKVVGGLAIGFIGLKIASMGVRWGFSWIADGAGMAYRAMTMLRPSVFMATVEMHRQKAAAIGSAIAIKARSAAVWTAGSALKAYAIGSTLVVRAMRAVTIASRFMGAAIISNPIGLAITALAVGATLIIMNWSKVKAFLGTFWEGIKTIWSAAVGWVGSAIDWLGQKWKTVLNAFLWVNPITMPIMALNKLVQFVSSINLFQAGQKIIGSLWEGIVSMAEKPVGAVKNIVGKMRNLLPFSPAKEGPFRDLNKVNIGGTIAETIKPAPVVSAMSNVMSSAKAVLQPIAQPSGLMPAMATGYGGPAMPAIQITQQFYIQGSPDDTAIKKIASQTYTASEDAIMRVIEKYFTNKARKEW